MNRLLRVLLSIICVMIGIVGLILPVLPGWLFFGFALILIFPDAPMTQRSVARIEARFPSTRRFLRFLTGER
jgi:uncharacterized membrane protein YbaN (DUF454 family)